MFKRGKSLLLASAASVAMTASPALADGDLIQDLQRQIISLQEQIDALAGNSCDSCGTDVEWKGAAKIKGEDRDFKVRGRLMLDYASVDGDGVNDYVDNAIEARRARLGVEGKLQDNTKYKFEVSYDPADESIDIEDAYIKWGTAWGDIALGQQKVPVSLEEQTSSRYITFMERAAFTDAFGFQRQVGAVLSNNGDNYSIKAGVFGANLNDEENDEGYTVAARGTFSPTIGNGDTLVHLGASIAHSTFEDTGTKRYRVRPLVHQEDRYIDTGSIADEELFYGVEGAAVFGPFSVQGEYGRLDADMPSGGSAEFDGWYIDASWFLTGESRKYKKGSFSRVSPANPVDEGGMGAWQIALRYDSLDMSDYDTNGALPGSAGEQESYVVGVNWHLNKYTRMMFNYNHTEIEDSLENLAETGLLDNDIDAWQLRAQIDW